LLGAVIVCYLSLRRFYAHKSAREEESGMEKLLNSLTGTVIAGFVLTVIVAVILHAIH
jgi:hypothetical protein